MQRSRSFGRFRHQFPDRRDRCWQLGQDRVRL